MDGGEDGNSKTSDCLLIKKEALPVFAKKATDRQEGMVWMAENYICWDVVFRIQ